VDLEITVARCPQCSKHTYIASARACGAPHVWACLHQEWPRSSPPVHVQTLWLWPRDPYWCTFRRRPLQGGDGGGQRAAAAHDLGCRRRAQDVPLHAGPLHAALPRGAGRRWVAQPRKQTALLPT
jgi:hypothetical protein